MIAVDTSILVYAHRADSEWHETALRRMMSLSEGSSRWAIPWPCIHEFLPIVTHPRIYAPPTALEESIAMWLELENCVGKAEGPGSFEVLRRLAREYHVGGGLIHDARIAALCLHHRVAVLWSSDRDFSRFPESRA